MNNPLPKSELERIKSKYAEKNIFVVIDAQRNKNTNSLEEDEKKETVNDKIDECPELAHLSTKQESIMEILKNSSTKEDKNGSITDIDWKKVKII